jgi:hypothetical protein
MTVIEAWYKQVSSPNLPEADNAIVKMWRRFGMGQRPSSSDNNGDDGYLETIDEVDSIISRQNSVRHPSNLPELPL